MAEQATSGLAGLLRQLRAEARLTQQELAKAAGVSPRSVSDLERGINRTARQDTAVRLAGALGLAEPARSLFVAAARGRIQAAQVLTAKPRQAPGDSPGSAAGVYGFVPALTSFVGRAGPVREVAVLLDRDRLVTVTGPGGAGKTRLAGEVARQVAGRFADGAWLAELAPVRDPALVPAVVAAALGVREQPGLPAAGALARVLARRQLLLVLDNCEHVIGAAAELCAGLLAACDDVRVLATSREPLRVAGEARYRLGPLGLPGLDDLAHVAGSEAVALFADRARRADARFALDGRDRRRWWRGWCGGWTGCRWRSSWPRRGWRRWAWRSCPTGSMTGSGCWTAGDRLAPDRHRSLAATVEWSYQLLDERRAAGVPRGVGVPGGVHAGGRRGRRRAGRRPGGAAAGGLLAAGPAAGRAGWPVPVRDAGDAARLRGRAAGRDRGAGRRPPPRWPGTRCGWPGRPRPGLQTSDGELAAARWLDAEDATMRQALAWAMEHDTAVALRLANALGWWWFLRGRLAGEYPLLCQAAGRAEAGSGGWCAAQLWLGWAAQYSADLAAALGHFTAVRDAVADRPPSRALTSALAGRAEVLRLMGRTAEAAGDARRCAGPGPGDRGPGRGAAWPWLELSSRRLLRRRS